MCGAAAVKIDAGGGAVRAVKKESAARGK